MWTNEDGEQSIDFHSELHGKSPSIHQSLLFVPQLSVTASFLTRLMTPGHTKPVGRLKQRCLTVRWKVNDSFDVTCHNCIQLSHSTLHLWIKAPLLTVNPIEVQWPELRWLETGNGTGLELMAGCVRGHAPQRSGSKPNRVPIASFYSAAGLFELSLWRLEKNSCRYIKVIFFRILYLYLESNH